MYIYGISQLEELKEKHGDLPVYTFSPSDSPVHVEDIEYSEIKPDFDVYMDTLIFIIFKILI